MKFRHALKLHNIQLLRDDELFIKRLIVKYPKKSYEDILSNYVKEWLAGRQACANEIKKENAGRYRANMWLLTFST
jgi:hypothetical protein